MCLLPLKTNETDKERERKREKITMAETSITQEVDTMATSNSLMCDIAVFRRLITLTIDIHAESSSKLELELMDSAFRTSIPIGKLMERRIDGPDSAYVPAGIEQPFIVTEFEGQFFIDILKDKMRSLITNNFHQDEAKSGHPDGWTSKNNGIDMILNDSTVHAIIHYRSYKINTTKDLCDALERSYTEFKYRKKDYSLLHEALIYPDLKFTLRIGTIYHRHNEDKKFNPLDLYCYTHNFNLIENLPLNLELSRHFTALA